MPVKVMNPTDKYVGSRVRLHHLMLGMSQGALADNSWLTFQQVQKYEKGVNRIARKRPPGDGEDLPPPGYREHARPDRT